MLKRFRGLSVLALAMTALLLSSGAMAGWQLNMTRGVTDISEQVWTLHMAMMIIVTIIGILVFGVMFWAMFRYRRSRNPNPATWHENTRLEVLWTVVPIFILVAMTIPATVVLAKIYDTPSEAMTVKIDGYQWRWEYTYLADTLDEQVSFFSSLTTPQSQIQRQMAAGVDYLLEVDNPLVIPVDTPVRFLITSNDVIHSWWVPDFGIKKDAVPGIINEAHTTVNETGIYRGMCAELCGNGHAYMPIVVEVVEQEEYEAWMAEQRGDSAAIEVDQSLTDNTVLSNAAGQ